MRTFLQLTDEAEYANAVLGYQANEYSIAQKTRIACDHKRTQFSREMIAYKRQVPGAALGKMVPWANLYFGAFALSLSME